jgi:tetratricopeptide (TPR) repeat protein
MRRPGIIVVCALAIVSACRAGGTGAITGVVRDASGAPIEGARITITAAAPITALMSSITGGDGRYRFEFLAAATYTVVAEHAGFVPVEHANVQPATSGAVVDFTLLPARPAPKLQAAGIRGLIDPGGYSASANQAGGSALMASMADLKRGGSAPDTSAAALPCSAEPDLRRRAETQPADFEANGMVGRFYLAHGSYREAIRFLDIAHRTNSADPEVSLDLAAAMIGAQQFEYARKVLANVKGAAAHNLLAEADEGLGRFQEAAAEYNDAAAEQPAEQNLFGAGYELLLSGDANTAAKVLRSGLDRYPRSALLMVGLGAAQFLAGQPLDALHAFLQAARIVPSDPRPYAFLAKAFVATGAEPEAVTATMKRFSDAAPDDGQAQLDYAVVLLRQRTGNSKIGAFGDIQNLLERALALNPKLAEAHEQLAKVYLEEQNYPGAIGEYQTTAQLMPGKCDILYRLSTAYRRAMRDDKAEAELKLFKMCHSQEKETAEGITVEQFVSVIKAGPPEGTPRPCEQTPRQ